MDTSDDGSETMSSAGVIKRCGCRDATEWLAGTAADRAAQGWTLERWLRHWLDTRTQIRPTTRFHYTRDEP